MNISRVHGQERRQALCQSLITLGADLLHVPQKANIDGIRALVNKLNDLASETGQARALLGSILSATAGASAPSIAPIKTVTKQTKLIIGDEDEFPGESLSFNVLVQKATQKASAKSMQKMRKGTWKKSLSDTTGINSLNGDKKKKRKRGSDDEDEAEEEDDDDRTTFHDPGALVPEKVRRMILSECSAEFPIADSLYESPQAMVLCPRLQ